MLFFNKVVVVAVFVSIQSIHPKKKQTVEKPKDTKIDGFTLVVASWVIRARWWEIQRFVLEFKAS